jgi:aspartate-semialdehyde dehydrogenase
MNDPRGCRVAVLGAATELGGEVCRVLRERRFPIRESRFYDSPSAAEHVDDEMGVVPVDPGEADLGGIDVAFLCTAAEDAMRWIPGLVRAGAVAVDLSQAHSQHQEIPAVVPEVNPDSATGDESLIGNPVPGAIALAIVLNPLESARRLRRVVVSCLEPVSSAGHAGVEELARQTADLLSGRTPEIGVFPKRVAFNVIPQTGDLMAGGRTRAEWLIESQTRRILDLPDLPLTVSVAQVPVFFGHGYLIHVETEDAIDAETASAALREAPGLLLLEGTGPDSYASLADVIGGEAAYVSRVREDPTVPSGVSFWAALDGLRKGGAVNAVQIAEIVWRVRRR